MERLIYRDKNGITDLKMTNLKDPCEYCKNAIEKLAYYEDLEELNLLPMAHGGHGALSKEEAIERLGMKGGIE